jgi:Bacterial Ig-like domain
VLDHSIRSARHRAAMASLVAVFGLGVALLIAPVAHALGAPGGLGEDTRNGTTHVLSWAPVAKATSYEVQVDTDAGFDSPDFTATTVNRKVVPTKVLPSGDAFWRVRSVSGSTRSGWSKSSFAVAVVSTPIPLAPASGESLSQPQDPPLLQWTGVQGATSYTVEVDADSDMIGAKTYTSKSTSFVVPDPLTAGDWFWRVTASKGTGLNSLPSDVQSFDVQPLPAPQITYPVDDINQTLEDVVLDWTPVPGAKTYDVQVALDADFNNIALSVTGIQSTRYSPPTTLNSDQFWWRVRAVDPAGQQTEWTSALNGFQRVWPEAPQPVYPLGATGSPSAISGTKAYFQWTPVRHATEYELQVSTDPNFSPSTSVTKTCTTAQTTYTPRAVSSNDCLFPSGPTVFYWRVRPIDLPYPNGLPGIYSTPQAFTYTPPAPPAGGWDPNATVTGLKIGVDGTGATTGGKGCAGASPDDECANVPSTPVLSWNPVPGAGAYLVYYAQNANFTTTEIPQVPVTTNTIFQLSTGNSLSSLPDSQAGKAYYWHVRPCTSTSLATCAPDPESSGTVLPDTRSFQKASPAIHNLVSSNPNASEITFSWQDYYDTSVATTWNGETSNETAKNYRIEVDNDSSFATPVDNQVVDQTTYTEHAKLYAEGTYWWRVQALDDENQGQTWSAPQSFTKSSPPVTPDSPASGAHVAGTTPFRWDAAPFAASYNLEVYKNDDHTFSSANRVVTANVKTTAYAPPTPLPADATNYLWRVRRVDASNNPGPWSSPASFYSTGDAASAVRPANGIWVSARDSLFEWSEVPGAASYQLIFTGTSTSKFSTAATAYAPTSVLRDGAYSWRVVALDAGGHSLGSSAPRDFRVDGTAPIVTKLTPTTLKPSSTIKATFSERVHGVSGKSVKLYKLKGKKRIHIRAKVTVLKQGKVAALDPRHRLSPGHYQVVFLVTKIRDRAGNMLGPSSVAQPRRSAVSWTSLDWATIQ